MTEFIRAGMRLMHELALPFLLGVSASAAAVQNQVPGNNPFLIVLGVAQDAGYPQAGTKDPAQWENRTNWKNAACLGIVDPLSGERWLLEATPDFKKQLYQLDKVAPVEGIPGLNGIFLTHAHIGHYAGLIHIGHEVIGASEVPVYAMPRMAEFLRKNGPWDQLVSYKNISLREMQENRPVKLNQRLSITPFRVPHRDEYSETVGFRIDGPKKSVIFLPDIDKWKIWEEWGVKIEDLVKEVDLAFLDASFYADGEVPGRDMATIKHPFIVESMQRFQSLPARDRNKVRFIHLNHTNPALFPGEARRTIQKAGFGVADELEIHEL